jgi:hypothetical protein
LKVVGYISKKAPYAFSISDDDGSVVAVAVAVPVDPDIR